MDNMTDIDYTSFVKQLNVPSRNKMPDAQFYLGFVYEHWNSPQNHQEALKWYCKAAKQNHAMAQFRLGLMQYRGLIGNANKLNNKICAYMCFLIAKINSKRGSIESVEIKGAMIGLRRELGEQELKKALSLARQCIKSGYQNCGDCCPC